MKRALVLLLLTVVAVAGCKSSTLSLNEISNIPKNVQNEIDPDHTLQLIDGGKDISYIIFHSKGEVTSNIETEGKLLKIKFDVSESQNDNIVQHVFKLTHSSEQDAIEVFINEESTPFDVITVINL